LVEKRGWGVRLDLLTFDYEEARKPGSQEKQKLPQSSQRNAGMGFTTEARRIQRLRGFCLSERYRQTKRKTFGALDLWIFKSVRVCWCKEE
jgi:hypothetical protein